MQRLKFSIYDLDNESASLGDDDFLGYLECSLGEVCVLLKCVNIFLSVFEVHIFIVTCTVLFTVCNLLIPPIDSERQCLYQATQWERQQRTRNNYCETSSTMINNYIVMFVDI